MCDRNLTEEKKRSNSSLVCLHLQLGCDKGACLKGLSNSPPKKIYVFTQKQQISYPFKPPRIQQCSSRGLHRLCLQVVILIAAANQWPQPSHVVPLTSPISSQSISNRTFEATDWLQRSYADHRSLGITVSGRIEWHVTAEPTNCLQVVSPWPAAKDWISGGLKKVRVFFAFFYTNVCYVWFFWGSWTSPLPGLGKQSSRGRFML